MHYLKVLCGFACFLILASNVWSTSRWSEARGVYDDVCYLRQAHLFQRFGLGGLDTDISRDDDRYLTARLFLAEQRQQHRLLLTGLVGLLIGLAVNFRLPNLFLSSGYFLFFFISFLLSRKIETALQAMVFGAAFLLGMVPALAANAINAGSPLSTTYGGVDVTPPDFSF